MAVVDDYTALLSGFYWTPTFQQRPVILTYSFATTGATGNRDAATTPFVGPLDGAHQDLVRTALKTWGDNSGIIFIETKKAEGDLNFGVYKLNDPTTAADAGLPSSGAFVQADGSLAVFGGTNDLGAGVVRYAANTVNMTNDQFMHVTLHEVGHALGLKHPFDTDPNITLNPTKDNGAFTVMTYKDYLPTLGTLDLDAVHALYGTQAADAAYPFAWSYDANTDTLRQTGTAAGEYIKGSRGNDVIDSGGGKDAIVTFAGDDTILVRGGSIQINAGTGFDFVSEDVSRSAVSSVQYDKANAFASLSLGADTQTLIGVERVGFKDATLAFDIDGNAGQAYRIYQAAFNRTPDAAGLSFWVKAMDAGSNLRNIAAGFVSSAEFSNLYTGINTNVGYIGKLYQNVLHRDGEAAGMAYWEGQMNNGVTKEVILANFSESAENITGTTAATANGIWYT